VERYAVMMHRELLRGLLVLLLALALVPGPAFAGDEGAGPAEPESQATPEGSPPTETPSPPAAKPPAPPSSTQSSRGSAASSGQWVYTEQYGWVWMPYGDAYTYVPPGGEGEPYEYLYYPAYGWTWVVAPWVWGFGPWPFFGVVGPVHFHWYAHGWWRSPWRWHYRPAPFYGGFAYHGFRAAPVHGGFVARGPPAHGYGARGFTGGHSGRGGHR
jgi:hypothetical protein